MLGQEVQQHLPTVLRLVEVVAFTPVPPARLEGKGLPWVKEMELVAALKAVRQALAELCEHVGARLLLGG